jgi:mono/diheme cytochrome c family protein
VPQGTIAHGDYLVKVACTNCHLLDAPQNLGPGRIAPALREMAPAYDLAQFTHLMLTGKGIGERELGLMSDVARTSFVHLTEDEIAAIHAYLTAPTESGK